MKNRGYRDWCDDRWERDRYEREYRYEREHRYDRDYEDSYEDDDADDCDEEAVEGTPSPGDRRLLLA